METNYFDPAKSIEGLAQFDQAAANSALTFSANFITQIDALAVSLQTMADTAAAALTTAFSTGAVAMSESVGASILDITTKIQEMQIIGSEAFANIEIAFSTAFSNILTALMTKQEEFDTVLIGISESMKLPFCDAEGAYNTAFLNILTGLIEKKDETTSVLEEFQNSFTSISDNIQNVVADNLKAIEEKTISNKEKTLESNSSVEDSYDEVDNVLLRAIDTTIDLVGNFNTLYKGYENFDQIVTKLLPNIFQKTAAQAADNVATGAAGATSAASAPQMLAFGAATLMVGSGVLLAGMAIALLAKVAFNTFKMFGMNTHGVKADDFNLKFEIPGLADGGIPGYGELFIAREAGPEFVGSFGSRNVVMNNNQIVDAVSGGVYDAVRRANAEQSQQPIYLNVEAKVRENVLFDMMETVRAERGVRLSTGGAWYKNLSGKCCSI